MKHCHDCNLSFPDNYRFCGSCGAGLTNAKACPTCGDIIEAKWEFCTSCGRTTSVKVRPAPQPDDSIPRLDTEQPQSIRANEIFDSALPRVETHAWYEAPELLKDTEEITAPSMRVSHVITPERSSHRNGARGFRFKQNALNRGQDGKEPPTLSMLSAYGGQVEQDSQPVQPTYPIFVGAGLIILLMTIGFGVWYVFAHRAAAATQSDLTSARTQIGNDLSLASGGGNRPEAPRLDTRDEDWRRLNEKRKSATPAEQPELIAALDEAESRYTNDYRFPYERAKLSIKGVTAHDEAFRALREAAERAIDNGQAEAMLRDLLADKDGDFWKLARGHHEWHELIEALEAKDTSRLRKH